MKYEALHQKGITMKLIQILALATAMATMATAQNSSANGQTSGAAKPSPTATPAAAKSNATPAKTAPANAAAKKSSPKPAAGANSQTSSAKPAAPSGTAVGSAAKPTASSGTAAGSAAKPAASSGTAAGSAAKPTASSGTAAGPAAKPAAQTGTAVGSSAKPAVKTTTTPVKAQAGTAAQGSVKGKAAPTPVIAVKTGTPAKPAAKPPAVIAVKPVQSSAAKKTGATQAKKTPAKIPAPAPKVTQTGPSTAAKPAEKPKTVARAFGAHGRRDPFVSPIRTGSVNSGPTPNCTSGKRCLSIPELVLQGTVKDTTGKMMAVVANSTKKTYFLRENDQVFNGSVEKITSDSIIFREYVKDPLGRETAREVVKKLVPTS
jgi:Tfp pilus assembly protein PilP